MNQIQINQWNQRIKGNCSHYSVNGFRKLWKDIWNRCSIHKRSFYWVKRFLWRILNGSSRIRCSCWNKNTIGTKRIKENSTKSTLRFMKNQRKTWKTLQRYAWPWIYNWKRKIVYASSKTSKKNSILSFKGCYING